ncbi:MAG TPA: CbiX/SirB N-terminal domain-containing protein [Segeticoccus sp.]|uniref:sirohydrochlorin chelatase n=1 Tax=Segeticoccus sp. TaxID=2706531 RepID=UPI002D80E28F|nr:CbiX/SirB N-terminal domain-containing protein [Segeticoccus sp.]HET8600941.1 CbiX/SirB N-terminal domain-containing protein [Segeticoccus sp.]
MNLVPAQTRSPSLVLAAHGTHRPEGPRTLAALADLARHRLPGTSVAVGFVDVIGPTVADVVAVRLAEHACAVVVPVFLGTGHHVEVDLPKVAAGREDRVLVTPALGPVPEVVRAVADRLRQASTAGSAANGQRRLPDAVVLAAAGSTRERSRRESAAAARSLASLLGRPVTVGFASGAGPSVVEAVWRARAVEGAATVGVASYLLAPGVFQERLGASGADVVAQPIGAHPAVADLVVRRYLEAVEALEAVVPASRRPVKPKATTPRTTRATAHAG